MQRRRLLSASFSALAGMATIGVASAGSKFLVGDSLQAQKAQWVQISAIDELSPDQMHRVNYSVRVQDAWQKVEQTGTLFIYVDEQANNADRYNVLDATCTHLGCLVRWQEDKQHFACPCHAGFFDRTGEILEGPPPTALHKLPTKIENGILWAEV